MCTDSGWIRGRRRGDHFLGLRGGGVAAGFTTQGLADGRTRLAKIDWWTAGPIGSGDTREKSPKPTSQTAGRDPMS